jgi:hypothetical protein
MVDLPRHQFMENFEGEVEDFLLTTGVEEFGFHGHPSSCTVFAMVAVCIPDSDQTHKGSFRLRRSQRHCLFKVDPPSACFCANAHL